MNFKHYHLNIPLFVKIGKKIIRKNPNLVNIHKNGAFDLLNIQYLQDKYLVVQYEPS